jgi:hypothetical protein
MRYACLIYFEPKKAFNQSPEAEEVLRDSMDPNTAIKVGGHMVMDAALQLPDQAVTVTVRDGQMAMTDGPFAETKEILGGIILIEAGDITEAARLAATIPLARLGAVEVRPLVDYSKPRPVM